ncbi:hypothetical protein BH10ACT2_BH10ACT2_23170 [soil metagenome]
MSAASTAVDSDMSTSATAKTPVSVGNATGALGSRVRRLLTGSATLCPAEAGAGNILVWLAADSAVLDRGSLGGLSTVLDESAQVRHIVLVSSAMVYGAWENNPVPLTEDALLRPDVEFAFARQLGAAEQLVDEWRRSLPGRTVTVLRPAIGMAADDTNRLAAALAAGMGQRVGTADPPAQFLHLDDLADAVLLAAEKELDGVFNVAPDGWIAGERVRALAGAVPRIKLPDRVSEVITNLRWRFQRGPIPPGLRSYTRSPWLVANDRLKAVGWQPKVTNEQAYVEGTEGKWWTMVSPKRRQEITLGAAAIAAFAGVVLVVRAIRRARRVKD